MDLINFDWPFFLFYLCHYFLFNISFSWFIIDWIWIEAPAPFWWIEYSILIYLIHLWLLLLWRLIYKKLNLKRKNYWNIYFLAFVLRLFPVLSIFASILLWMNDEKLSKVIKIFSIWFILYTIVWFILYKYFDLSWLHLFYSGD